MARHWHDSHFHDTHWHDKHWVGVEAIIAVIVEALQVWGSIVEEAEVG